jgi:hypothetical protein
MDVQFAAVHTAHHERPIYLAEIGLNDINFLKLGLSIEENCIQIHFNGQTRCHIFSKQKARFGPLFFDLVVVVGGAAAHGDSWSESNEWVD